jgi:hypothetical protein
MSGESKKSDYITIKIRRETAQKLQAMGRYGDTYDSIINRLIENAPKRLLKHIQK